MKNYPEKELKRLRNEKFFTEFVQNVKDKEVKRRLNKGINCRAEFLKEKNEFENIPHRCNDQRFCIRCANIKSMIVAKNLSQYIKEKTFNKEMFFFTMTFKNEENNNLWEQIKERKEIFNLFRKRLKKEGLEFGIGGLYAMETTYNNEKKWYHIHFHGIIFFNKGKGTSEIIKINSQWRILTKNNPIDFERVYSYKKTYKEIFKYICKINKDNIEVLNTFANTKIINKNNMQLMKPFRKLQTFGGLYKELWLTKNKKVELDCTNCNNFGKNETCAECKEFSHFSNKIYEYTIL